jgi:uncharacterized repeat protein (TIGR03847 family)
MADAKVDFTRISRLDPESVGEPGQRTFRIIAESDSSIADVWLEKEQLFQLALAVHQLLATVREGEDAAAASSAPVEREADPLTRVDFKAGRLALRHEDSHGMFIIEAHDMDAPQVLDEDSPPDVALWAGRSMIERFADLALRLCAAGRPLCPLCGAPMDPEEMGGHKCPRVNGNHSISAAGDL